MVLSVGADISAGGRDTTRVEEEEEGTGMVSWVRDPPVAYPELAPELRVQIQQQM